MIRLEARPEPSRTYKWASPLIAVAATVVVGLLLFPAMGKNPVDAFHAFFVKPIDSLYGVAELLLKAAPLMLIATGLAAGFAADASLCAGAGVWPSAWIEADRKTTSIAYRGIVMLRSEGDPNHRSYRPTKPFSILR